MTEDSNTTLDPAQQTAADNAPFIGIAAQYVKDLSFENPKSPRALTAQVPSPQVNLNVHVDAAKLDEKHFEVVMKVEAKAETPEKDVVFIVELAYGAVIALKNIEEKAVRPLLLIEAPRLLFPFVREIVATVTKNGGFPPLLINPIDFASLYRENLQKAAKGQEAAKTA